MQDTIRMVLDAVIGLGVDGFVKASKSGDRDQEKVVRGQLAVASWLLALHAVSWVFRRTARAPFSDEVCRDIYLSLPKPVRTREFPTL